MRRKVIQQNPTTKVISLPKKWVTKHEIQKGDYITLHEHIDSLIITKSNDIKRIARLDVRNISDKRTLRIILDDLYRKGFDEFKLKIEENQSKPIRALVSQQNFLGFEIFSDNKKEIRISNFSEPKDNQFDNILLKIVFIIKEMMSTYNIDKEFLKIGIKYAKYLRRTAHTDNKTKQYDDLLRTLMVIIHSLERMNKYNQIPKSKAIKEESYNFFLKTFEGLRTGKTSFNSVQKDYIRLEKKLLQTQNKENLCLLWEVIRNISMGAYYLESLQLSKTIP